MDKDQEIRRSEEKPLEKNTVNKNPGSPEDQRVATNPNPRANANIKTADPEQKSTEGVGTEITDGEGG